MISQTFHVIHSILQQVNNKLFGAWKNLSETFVWGIQQCRMMEIKQHDDKAMDGGTLPKF